MLQKWETPYMCNTVQGLSCIVCDFLHFSFAMQYIATTFTILPNHPHSLACQMGMKNNKPTVAVLEIYCSVCHKFTKHQYCVIC